MGDFERALNFTLLYEGGYSDDPADPGGATNFGVTQKTYDVWRKAKGAKLSPVRFIGQSEVKAIYRDMYYGPSGCNYMRDPLALVVFDTAVNFGVTGAVKFLQEALGLKADGLLGPITLKAVSKSEQDRVAIDICKRRMAFRYERIKKNKAAKRFLQGWLNRDQALLKYVAPTA